MYSKRYFKDIERRRVDLLDRPPSPRATEAIFYDRIRELFPDAKFAYALNWTPDQYVDFYTAMIEYDVIFSMKVIDPDHPLKDEEPEESVGSVSEYRETLRGRRRRDFDLIMADAPEPKRRDRA